MARYSYSLCKLEMDSRKVPTMFQILVLTLFVIICFEWSSLNSISFPIVRSSRQRIYITGNGSRVGLPVSEATSHVTLEHGIDAENVTATKPTEPSEECFMKTKEMLEQAITEASLNEMFHACLSEYDYQEGINSNPFNKIFQKLIFRDVDCPQRNITYSDVQRDKVALTAFEGSGSTWTRQLLEQLTGIYTGTISGNKLGNFSLKGAVDCPTKNGAFIIKTHALKDKVTKEACLELGIHTMNYTKAIVLMRNPYNAMLAEFHRRHGGPTGYAPEKSFFEGKGWYNFVRQASIRWQNHARYWLTSFKNPVYILVFENMVSDLLWELYKLFKFLDFPITFKSLWCTSINREGAFHRKKPHWIVDRQLFTPRMEILVGSLTREIQEIIHRKFKIKQDPYKYTVQRR